MWKYLLGFALPKKLLFKGTFLLLRYTELYSYWSLTVISDVKQFKEIISQIFLRQNFATVKGLLKEIVNSNLNNSNCMVMISELLR